MAEFAHVAFGPDEPFHRIARVRRRALTVHMVAAGAAVTLLEWVIGGPAVRAVDWTEIALVGVAAVAQLGGLLVWARWAWRVRGLRPPLLAPGVGPTPWERRRLREGRNDRAVGVFGRVVAVGCCWWLECTCLAAALLALSDPDADVPGWSVTNVVLPMLLLAMVGVGVAVRFPVRMIRDHRLPPRTLRGDADPFRDFYDL